MARQEIDLTTPQPNGKMGEPTKSAWEKVNDMTAELYPMAEDGVAALTVANAAQTAANNAQATANSADTRLSSIGWGTNPLSFSSNLDAVNRSLVQAFANPAGTQPTNQQYGTVTVLAYGANEYTQLAQSVTNSEMAFRFFNGQFGGWQPWSRLWHTNNTTVDSNNFIKRA